MKVLLFLKNLKHTIDAKLHAIIVATAIEHPFAGFEEG
jgi:hypothetical protein